MPFTIIIVRGIDKGSIFRDSENHRTFLERLGLILNEASTTCFAWALLTNHAHLLLQTGTSPATTVMRKLLTGYAQQFNRRYNRHAYLFRSRYKSFFVEAEPYLLELVRYIHLNPMRARMVETMEALDRDPRTGHSALMGIVNRPWQDTASVLGFFGQDRSQYRTFVEKGISRGKRPDLIGGGLIRSSGGWVPIKELKKDGLRLKGDERILGSSEFVNSVLKTAREDYERSRALKAAGLTLDVLITEVAHHLNVDEALIRSAGKQRIASRARAIIAHLALNRLRLTGAETAKALNLTPSAVSKLTARGRTDELSQEIEEKLPGLSLGY